MRNPTLIEKSQEYESRRKNNLNFERQKMLLKQYEGKALTNKNLKRIFDQMKLQRITPSKELEILFETVGLVRNRSNTLV
ncbi:MAG: hypothetical protein ACPGJI_02050 [Kangiellaceae bacterium]